MQVFLLSWGILFFFLAQSGQFAAGCYQADLAYLGCTLLASVLFAVLALRGVDCHLRSIADIGCVLMIIGTLLTAQVDAGSAGWLASLIAGKAAAGMGLGLLWVAWGVLFYRCEIGQVESAFLGWIPLLALLLVLAVSAKALDSTGLCFDLLFVSMPLFAVVAFRRGMTAMEKDSGVGDALVASEERPAKGGRVLGSAGAHLNMREAFGGGLGTTLVSLTLSFSLVSLAWGVLLPVAELSFEETVELFAAGCVLTFLVVWISMRNTRRWSLSTMHHWMLPAMVAGVALFQYADSWALAGACLCLTMVNMGFEISSRLLTVHLAKRNEIMGAVVVPIGFACAAIGGIVGCCGGMVVASNGADPKSFLLIVLFLFSMLPIVIGSGEPESVQAPRSIYGDSAAAAYHQRSAKRVGLFESERPEATLADRCEDAAKRYKLSAREAEVLPFLVQGRSRAFIRETLFISKGTVDTHVAHIYSKMGVNSKDELMNLVLDGGDRR